MTAWSHVTDQPSEQTETVPCMRLDDLKLSAQVTALKIDVEGFEASVLRGAKQLIQMHRPIIFLELGKNRQECRSILNETGYVLKSQSEGKFVEPTQSINYFAFPSDWKSM